MDSSWVFVFIAFVYYVYFFLYPRNLYNIARPPGTPDDPPAKLQASVESIHVDTLAIFQDQDEWKQTFQAPYMAENDRVYVIDECYNQPDHSHVLAKGKSLYDYMKNDKLDGSSKGSVPNHVKDIIQDPSRVFYFQCMKNRIDSLHVCQPGSAFDSQKCTPVNPCTSQKYPGAIADASDSQFFFWCDGKGKADRQKCPDGTSFLHDSCRQINNFQTFCKSNPKTGYLKLDDLNWIECDSAGHPEMFKCPPETVLIGPAQCQSNACRGRNDGDRVAMPVDPTSYFPFRFSPGFYECQDGQINKTVYCSDEKWDTFNTKGEDVTSLPRVFDGKKCSDPELCENVVLNSSSDYIVPSHHFTKYVNNWESSMFFDEVVGYRCVNHKKQKIVAPPGKFIKFHKFEWACSEPNVTKVVVGEQHDSYYDCSTKQVVKCGLEEFFDARKCQKLHPFHHKFENVGIFRLDNLATHDDWLIPWDYSQKAHPYSKPPKPPCTSPESEYLHGYNICSHPDCAKYAQVLFFSGIWDFPIIAEDGKTCFRSNELLKKSKETTVKTGFDFWNQRGEPEIGTHTKPKPLTEGCTFGKKVESGYFQRDSTLYMTCDLKQPFVFCPSVRTEGIVNVEGVYACVPPKETILQPGIVAKFAKNTCEKIIPLDINTTVFFDGNKAVPYPLNFTAFPMPANKAFTLEVTKPVKLIYSRRLTYPPNVWEENRTLHKVTPKNYNYVMRLSTWTNKALTFPTHKVIDEIE